MATEAELVPPHVVAAVERAAVALRDFTAPSKRARMNDLLFDYAQAIRADERARHGVVKL